MLERFNLEEHLLAAAQEIPRIILIATDSYGLRVLKTLYKELSRESSIKLDLTSFLQYQDEYGFNILGKDESDQKSHDTTKNDREDKFAVEFDTQNLRQQLYGARRIVCSQETQARLLSRNLRVGDNLEVFVIAQINGLKDLEQLRIICCETKRYLTAYEQVYLTVLVNLNECESPNNHQIDPRTLFDEFNRILFHNEPSADRIIERCYIITNETITGQAVISPGELEARAAKFLTLHYLDSLRQPMTQYQYLLLGPQLFSDPELIGDNGLCETFGYSDLEFVLSRVLDWCACNESVAVLRRTFLTTTESEENRKDKSCTILETTLQEAGMTLSTDILVNQMLERYQLDKAIIVESHVNLSPSVLLSRLREHRLNIDESLQRCEAQVLEDVNAIEEKLITVLRSTVDKIINTDPQGIRLARDFIESINGVCETESMRTSVESTAFSSCLNAMNKQWFALSRLVNLTPSKLVLWGRVVFLTLLAVLGFMLQGLWGNILVGVTVVSAVLWIMYAEWLLPRQLSQAGQRYLRALSSWYREAMYELLRSRFLCMVKNIQIQFKKPNTKSQSDAGEWEAVNKWIDKLTTSLEICEKWMDSMNPVQESRSVDFHQLLVSQEDLNKYAIRLMKWTPQEAALEFLKDMRASNTSTSGWWRNCEGVQLASLLRQFFRRSYDQQNTSEMNDLESHLVKIKEAEENTLISVLDSLLQTSLPMARLHRLHTRWELPVQKLLIVNNPKESVFRRIATERGVHLIPGTNPQKMICLQTIHHIPVRDLAISDNGNVEKANYDK